MLREAPRFNPVIYNNSAAKKPENDNAIEMTLWFESWYVDSKLYCGPFTSNNTLSPFEEAEVFQTDGETYLSRIFKSFLFQSGLYIIFICVIAH